ncbi:MAG: hypothetical protein VXX11_07095 [Planctomycetota bacterium]|nr:hypothetical protein [Planctomycetota bacterium]
MWDLKVIVAMNKVAEELAREGKNPNQAMAELQRRAKARAESKTSQDDGDTGEK